MFRKSFYISIVFCFSGYCFAGIDDKNQGTLLVDRVTSVYDGDSFRVDISSVHPLIGESIAIRVAGVDTPEIRGKCALEKDLAYQAKSVTESFLLNAGSIELRNVRRGKYFRIVADVYADQLSLSETLMDTGLAVAYDGGTKTKDWCKVD